ncbi:MAG: hypothetical protein ACTSQ8_07920 [Candidatus Helarchaeota archaeon]
MGATETATQPGSTIDVNGNSPSEDATIAVDDTMKAGYLVYPSTGTYGNGVDRMTANYGDSNTGESLVRQIEIPEIHPESNTPYDKSTAYKAGDHCEVKYHVVGKTYWLPASSITASKGDKIVPAGSGLVKKALAHTTSSKPVHMWSCVKAVTSGSWVQAEYLGMVPYNTANA